MDRTPRFERWATLLPAPRHLFLHSLHDHEAGLELFFSGTLEQVPPSRFRVCFAKPVAYQNRDEMFCLEFFSSLPPGEGSTWIVSDSAWLGELSTEPVLMALSLDLVHYVFVTQNDVVQVLSNEPPLVEQIPLDTAPADPSA